MTQFRDLVAFQPRPGPGPGPGFASAGDTSATRPADGGFAGLLAGLERRVAVVPPGQTDSTLPGQVIDRPAPDRELPPSGAPGAAPAPEDQHAVAGADSETGKTASDLVVAPEWSAAMPDTRPADPGPPAARPPGMAATGPSQERTVGEVPVREGASPAEPRPSTMPAAAQRPGGPADTRPQQTVAWLALLTGPDGADAAARPPASSAAQAGGGETGSARVDGARALQVQRQPAPDVARPGQVAVGPPWHGAGPIAAGNAAPDRTARLPQRDLAPGWRDPGQASLDARGSAADTERSGQPQFAKGLPAAGAEGGKMAHLLGQEALSPPDPLSRPGLRQETANVALAAPTPGRDRQLRSDPSIAAGAWPDGRTSAAPLSDLRAPLPGPTDPARPGRHPADQLPPVAAPPGPTGSGGIGVTAGAASGTRTVPDGLPGAPPPHAAVSLADSSPPAVFAPDPGSGAPGAAALPEMALSQDSPGADARLVRHIAAQLAPFLGEVGQGTDLRLDPEELGRLRLTVQTQDSTILLQVQADRPETADLIRRHIAELVQEFRAMGYAEVSVTLGERADGQRSGAGPGSQGPAAEGRPSGQTQTLPTAEVQPAARPAPSGLDLRL